MDLMTIGILVLAGAGLVAYGLWPKSNSREAVKRRLGATSSAEQAARIQEAAKQSTRQTLVKKATPMLSRLVMPVSDEEQTQLRMKLANAGFRQRQAQTLFLASKTAIMCLGLIGGVIAGITLQYQMMSIAGLAMFCAGAGFMAPNLWLSMAVSSRQTKVRAGLPDVLDLMVVSVESGLALDAAIKKVGEEMALVHPEISEEFRIATAESQMGIPRAEALDHLAMRSGVDELRGLVSVVAQAERFGTSIARALRNQGDAMRTKRRQEAEERAQKTAVKLMIPLVLFIFPAMGVVLAGPAAIKMFGAFSQ